MAGERGEDRTVKEQTVLVDVGDNRTVAALSVIKSIEEQVGEGVVEACVPKSGNLYEITLNAKDAVELICDTGFEVNKAKFKPNAVYSREKLVSFLNVSYYVPDEEIVKKLQEFGAELKTPIKRRKHPGTNVADGTRYVVVRFPNERQSLPYTMKLPTGINSHEYIRVIHDNQRKVCTKCFEASHTYANCPDNICFKCNTAGHLARNCEQPPCARCKKFLAKCKCEPLWPHNQRGRQGDPQDVRNENDVEDRMDDATGDVGNEGDVVKESGDELNLDEEDSMKTDTKSVDKVNGGESLKSDEQFSKNIIVDKVNHDMLKNFGGPPKTAEPVSQVQNDGMADAGHDKYPESSMAEHSDKEMTDEELAQAMSKISRRRRLVTSPYLTAEDVKRLRANPRNKLSSQSSNSSS